MGAGQSYGGKTGDYYLDATEAVFGKNNPSSVVRIILNDHKGEEGRTRNDGLIYNDYYRNDVVKYLKHVVFMGDKKNICFSYVENRIFIHARDEEKLEEIKNRVLNCGLDGVIESVSIVGIAQPA